MTSLWWKVPQSQDSRTSLFIEIRGILLYHADVALCEITERPHLSWVPLRDLVIFK